MIATRCEPVARSFTTEAEAKIVSAIRKRPTALPRRARPDLSLRDGPRNAALDRPATKTGIVAHHMDENSAQDVISVRRTVVRALCPNPGRRGRRCLTAGSADGRSSGGVRGRLAIGWQETRSVREADCPRLPADRDHLHPISGAPPPRPCESVRSDCPRLSCQMASVLPLVVEVVGDRPSSQKRSFIVLLALTDWGTHGDWRHRRGFEIQAARAVAQPIEARRSGADCPGMVAQPPISINFCLS